MDGLAQNLKMAGRQLRSNPGFTLTVVLTLALAIGANTAVFSIVNALLLKDLPYPQPERLGTIFARTSGPEPSDARRTIDGEQWELLRDEVPALRSAVSSLGTSGVNLRAGAHLQYLQAGRVSAGYFDVLGIRPILGRSFSAEEDRPGGPKVAILSHALWTSISGGNPDSIGRIAMLKGEPHTIIGVLPEHASTPLNADIYTALQPGRQGEGQAANFVAVMRLQDDAGWQQADVEINRALARSVRTQRVAKSSPGVRIAYYTLPLQQGQTARLRPQVLALMLAAGFILLIACANLAGLTLVRVFSRRIEIATRLALGASGWQIQRQLWVENLCLALVGGAAGAGTGFLALRGLLLLLPARFLPVGTVSLDGRVLAFTLGASLATSVLFGMLPALAARRDDLRSSVASRGVAGSGSVRLRQGLIVAEVALTVVLLAAAGLLIRTLIHLQTIPSGFNATGVMTAKASLDDVQYHDPVAFRSLLDRSLARIRQIPTVENAAVGLTLPYERALLNAVTLSDGKEAGRQVTTNQIYVTPGYFETLQIQLLQGRTFTDADNSDAQRVVVVNETFSRKFFKGENPLGRYLDKMRIVGVVGDTLLSSAAQLNAGSAPLTSEEAIYFPAAQFVDGRTLSLVHTFLQPSWIVRTSGQPQGVIAEMQRAVASTDPNLPFSGFYSMNDLMATTLTTQRIEVALLTTMASIALLLSAVGIFSLVASLVAHRTRELGIRMALGSTIARAMRHVAASAAGASAVGVVLGLVLCAGALRALRSVVYGVEVYDARTLLMVVVTVAAVTILATTVPALRVARIDPVRALSETS